MVFAPQEPFSWFPLVKVPLATYQGNGSLMRNRLLLPSLSGLNTEQRSGYQRLIDDDANVTLRDPPRPGPAHPREHGDSAAPKSLHPKQ